MRRCLALLAAVLVACPLVAQTSTTDSQTLRALLEEVRQLRRDLQTTTVAAQRVQIALYRLQLQDAAVARATRPVEEAHGALSNLTADRARVTAQGEQMEELRNRTQDPREHQAAEEGLSQVKRRLEQMAVEERQWQAKAGDAELQLKAEQAKQDALHAVLDQLDQALERVGRPRTDSTPPGQ